MKERNHSQQQSEQFPGFDVSTDNVTACGAPLIGIIVSRLAVCVSVSIKVVNVTAVSSTSPHVGTSSHIEPMANNLVALIVDCVEDRLQGVCVDRLNARSVGGVLVSESLSSHTCGVGSGADVRQRGGNLVAVGVL